MYLVTVNFSHKTIHVLKKYKLIIVNLIKTYIVKH